MDLPVRYYARSKTAHHYIYSRSHGGDETRETHPDRCKHRRTSRSAVQACALQLPGLEEGGQAVRATEGLLSPARLPSGQRAGGCTQAYRPCQPPRSLVDSADSAGRASGT